MGRQERFAAFALVILLGCLAVPTSAFSGSVRVRGHFRKDGTYVQPHYRSTPDSNPYNNYSFPGNYNPYTGKEATGKTDTYLEKYRHPRSPFYAPYPPLQETLPPSSVPSRQSTAFPVPLTEVPPTDPPKYDPACAEIDRVAIPEHAHLKCNPVVGNFWFCNPGYRRAAGQCVKDVGPLDVPKIGGLQQ